MVGVRLRMMFLMWVELGACPTVLSRARGEESLLHLLILGDGEAFFGIDFVFISWILSIRLPLIIL